MIRMDRPIRFATIIVFIGLYTALSSANANECTVFEPPVYYPGDGAGSSGICTADFNGDGTVDVAISSRWLDNVIIFSNDGNGNYSEYSETYIGENTTPRYVVAGDFNGDGHIDAATSNWNAHAGDPDDPNSYDGGSITVLLNDGTGVLSFHEDHVYLRASCLDIADLNGDGYLDIIAPHWDPKLGSSGPGIASILKNNGDGTFIEVANVPIGKLPRGIDVGDLDNDVDVDFAVSNIGDHRLTVVENLGDFNFIVHNPIPYVDGTKPRYVAIGDVTCDGWNDISVVHKKTNELLVYENHGNFNFSSFGTYPTSEDPHSVEVKDINGDCSHDVLVSHVGGNFVYIYENDGEGLLEKTVLESDHGPAHVISDDVNEDGRPDILTACVNGGYFNVHISETEQVGCEPLECRADLDNSGMVEVMDIIELISQWGTPCGPSDLNRSGVVDVLDIIELISVWGSECP